MCFITTYAYDACIDGIYYDLMETEAIVTHTDNYYYDNKDAYVGSIVIPEEILFEGQAYYVTSIGQAAFAYCTNLTSITMPNSITNIGESAFSYCRSLTSIALSNSLTYIDKSAFFSCSSLTSIIIPNSVLSIKQSAFLRCEALTSIYLGTSINEIGSYCFHECPNLKKLILNCKYIKSWFKDKSIVDDNTIIEDITFGEDVEGIDLDAFEGTTWMNNQPDGIIYAGSVAYKYKGNNSDISNITKIIIKDGTRIINNNLFKYWKDLVSVIIPNTVTRINEGAFSNCDNLISINLSSNLTSIDDQAFLHCTSLTSITIPESVVSIGNWAFAQCSSLTSINIPCNVSRIGEGAFDKCNEIKSIHISDLMAWCNLSFGNNWFSNAHRLFLNGCELQNVVIPYGITDFGLAFQNCSEIKSVIIPNGVTSIHNSAFSGCTNLTSVTIPNNVISIGNSAFANCANLSVINFPNSVTSIGNSAFSGCIKLASLTIPNNVTSIGKSAFYGCTDLESLKIGNGITIIDESSFSNCSGLTNLILPENLSIIKASAFANCSNLQYVTIPASTEVIYQNAFSGCNQLEYVSSLAETPPVLYSNSFSKYDIPLYVPANAIDAYQSNSTWNQFSSIGGISTYTLKYLVEGEIYKVVSLSEGAVIVPEPAPTKGGYAFSGWIELPTTMPAHDVTVEGTFDGPLPIQVGSLGITTVYRDYNLDFTNAEDVKAYTVTGYDNGNVTLTRLKNVPAYTGIVVIGNAGEYDIPEGNGKAYLASLMKGVMTDTPLPATSEEFTNFILSNGSDGICFYPTTGGTLAAGKAYLPIPTSVVQSAGIKQFGISFDDGYNFGDDTTGIHDGINHPVEEAWYTLSGQRLTHAPKLRGVYVRNGKKVTIK